MDSYKYDRNQSRRGLALIDGGFAKKLSRALKIEIDYAKLRDWLISQGFENIWYYNSLTYRKDTDEQPAFKLFDFLATNGYMVEIDEYEPEDSHEKFDVKIAIRAMRSIWQPSECTDILIMGISNGLLPLIEAINANGMTRVHLMTTWGPNSPEMSCSLEMRKKSWKTYNFSEMKGMFTTDRKK